MSPLLVTATKELTTDIGVAAACRATGLNRSSFYRHILAEPLSAEGEPGEGGSLAANVDSMSQPILPVPSERSPALPPLPLAALSSPGFSPTVSSAPASGLACRVPGRSLTSLERERVLGFLHSERFADVAPPEVYATLLDESIYLCSVSTMYRLLREHHEVRERRNQLRHPHYTKPELLATATNQVWSWDITKIKGPETWSYYYLYVILDIFSRYVVGWTVAASESSTLAQHLIEETCLKQEITAGQLTIHADRGSAMTSKPVAFLLADLGVTKTHSRPHVSNDNPYSEAQFKTLKYRPDFPARFESMEHARCFCQKFFPWYNTEHRHSGIGMFTPEAVHYDEAPRLLELRQQVLAEAYASHPKRFVRHQPRPTPLPEAAWINAPVSPPPDSRKENLH